MLMSSFDLTSSMSVSCGTFSIPVPIDQQSWHMSRNSHHSVNWLGLIYDLIDIKLFIIKSIL